MIIRMQIIEGPDGQCMARINRSSWAKPTATVIAPNFIVTAAHWSEYGSLVGKKVSIGSEDSDNYRNFCLTGGKNGIQYRIVHLSGFN